MQPINHLLSRLLCQFKAIALATQVELHQMLDAAWLRTLQYLGKQRRALFVGQMAQIAQDPADQQWVSAATQLHGDVMIELDREQIDIGE